MVADPHRFSTIPTGSSRSPLGSADPLARTGEAAGLWKLEPRAFEVPPARLFTYPTRIGAAWEPGVREIRFPERAITRPGGEVTVGHGVSHRRVSVLSAWQNRKQNLKRLLGQVCLAAQPQNFEGLIHDARDVAHGNVAHIHYELMPRLLLFRRCQLRPTVILGSGAPSMVTESVRLLGFEYRLTDRPVEGELVDAPSDASGYYEPRFRELWEGVTPEGGWDDSLPRKLFIARRGSRALKNHDVIESVLADLGYTTVYFEDHSLGEQWSMMRFAEDVVAVHGAALGHMALCSNRPRLVELFSPGYVVDCYRCMTAALDGRWSAALGQITPQIVQTLDVEGKPRGCQAMPFAIHPDSLEAAREATSGG